MQGRLVEFMLRGRSDFVPASLRSVYPEAKRP